MKKSRFSDQQIAFALQQAETGTSVADVCRKLRISEATLLPLEETLWWADALGGAQANAFCKKVKLPAKVRAIFSLARISIRSAAPERMHRELRAACRRPAHSRRRDESRIAGSAAPSSLCGFQRGSRS